MSDLLVIVPTRGRPASVVGLIQAFQETCRAETTLLFGLDFDDPQKEEYLATLDLYTGIGMRIEREIMWPRLGLVGTLNKLAWLRASRRATSPFAIGFMGDDHRPRTIGWDAAYLAALEDTRTGIVYGNDLIQGGSLPTQVAMTSDIIYELDYMIPPVLKHMYADNFWRDLGEEVGCIRYLPEVVIEHMHPIVNKAAWDEHYDRVNALMEEDGAAYRRYKELGDFAADVRSIERLRRW